MPSEQVKNSPDIDTDKPIVRQHEADLHKHYGWEFYWAGEAIMSSGGFASNPVIPLKYLTNKNGTSFDPHLRTTRVVTNYAVQATDKIIGWVSDFIVDDSTWTIQHIVINLQNVDHDKKMLINPAHVTSISLDEKMIFIDVDEEDALGFPDFNPQTIINKGCEEKAYDYYGRPKEIA